MKLILISLCLLLGACGAPQGSNLTNFDEYLEELMAEPYTADQME